MIASKGARIGLLAATGVIVVVAVAVTLARVRAELSRHEQLVEQHQRRAAIGDEILDMLQADQIHRDLILGHVEDSEEMTPERWQWHVDEAYRLNQVHAQRLREMVAELGDWPTIELVGEVPSASACLFAVHHYTDVEFLEWARDRMEPHVAERGISTSCYAQVFDRARLARSGKQWYGTQMRSEQIDGVDYFGIAPVEELEGLPTRRAELDLPDYADYITTLRQVYRVPANVGPFPDEPEIPGLVRNARVDPAEARLLTDEQRRLVGQVEQAGETGGE